MITLADYISATSDDHCNIEFFDIAFVNHQVFNYANFLSTYNEKTSTETQLIKKDRLPKISCLSF